MSTNTEQHIRRIDMTPTVSICIVTFKRPEKLKRLLSSISSMTSIDGEVVEIVVVDNDARKSAEIVVREFEHATNWNVLYFVEPLQNISRARNRSIVLASGEFCALIDDDEYPSAEWLAAHLSLLRDNVSISGSFGPVAPEFETAPPDWIVSGEFFQRRRSGNHFPYIAGNLIIRRSVLLDSDAMFKESLGLSGGEDTEFFHRLSSSGRKFSWCEQALVWEVIPSNRMTFRYMLTRAFRGGQTYVHILRESSPLRAIVEIGKGFVQCGMYSLLCLSTWAFSRKRSKIAATRLAVAVGKVAAVLGSKYEEYRHS